MELSAPELAAARLQTMAVGVARLAEEAGPIGDMPAEASTGHGENVFRALTGEPGETRVAAVEPTPTQKKMVATLYQIVSIYSEQYAPIEWKKENFAIDLKREYEKAKGAILADPAITSRKFQDVVGAFITGLRDYHVSVLFNSTERASLPFLVMEAQGRYFLANIDREKLPQSVFPFKVGDELLSFDGVPTAQAVAAIAAELGGNTKETDRRLAEIYLTNRRRARGDQVPQGAVRLTIRTRDGKLAAVNMPWHYVPELVPQDVPLRDAGLADIEPPSVVSTLSGIDSETTPPAPMIEPSLFRGLERLFTNMAHPLARLFAAMRAEEKENPHTIGARKSFVPKLGPVLWQSKSDNPFHAYIFKDAEGRKVGFIRIPSYDGGAKEVEAFAKIVTRFQKQTDALVIDQVNNPGGAVFYLYALASHLTDKPLITPKHHLIIDESDAQWAGNLLIRVAESMGSKRKKEAKDEDEDQWSGYPVTQKFVELMMRFAQFILTQLESGERFTDPTHLWGVDDIEPAPKAEERYTKPIVLLVNALDFSGGDFFPAILQDNKRATVFGVRTAGAGGAVKPYDLPNQFGIGDLSATWTMAKRIGGKPIENLGVTPDVSYEITAKDLQSGFSDYRGAVLKTLSDLLAAVGVQPQS